MEPGNNTMESDTIDTIGSDIRDGEGQGSYQSLAEELAEAMGQPTTDLTDTFRKWTEDEAADRGDADDEEVVVVELPTDEVSVVRKVKGAMKKTKRQDGPSPKGNTRSPRGAEVRIATSTPTSSEFKETFPELVQNRRLTRSKRQQMELYEELRMQPTVDLPVRIRRALDICKELPSALQTYKEA